MIVAHPNLRPYAEHKLGIALSDNAQFVGRLRENGEIWGVTAFDHFSTYDCEIFMCGEPGFGSRPLIKATFAYPFLQLGKGRVTARVDAADEHTLSIDKRLGFKEEGRLRMALGDRDIIVLGMLRDECRWLDGR